MIIFSFFKVVHVLNPGQFQVRDILTDNILGTFATYEEARTYWRELNNHREVA